MSPFTPVAPLPVATLAELAHQAIGPHAPALLSISFDADGRVSLGSWPGVGAADHPTDPLVGFVAPEAWHAIGLVAGGRGRALPGAPPPAEGLLGEQVVTAVVDRDGTWASMLGHPGEPGQALASTPLGCTPDALHRCLGLATPSPSEGPGAWLETVWLDRMAALVLGERPGALRSWRSLTDHHPLSGHRGLSSPEELARRTATFAASHPWNLLRIRYAAESAAALGATPPPGAGTVVEASQWFDDGSFSRWVMRNLPPAEVVLVDLVAVLPPTLGDRLVSSLTSVSVAGLG